MPRIKLGGRQEQRLQAALLAGFDSDDLMEDLLAEVDQRFDHLKVYGAVFPDHVRSVIRTADAEDWLLDLLDRACAQRPGDDELPRIRVELTGPAVRDGSGPVPVVDHLTVVLGYSATDGHAAAAQVRDALTDLPVTVRSGPGVLLAGADVLVVVLSPDAGRDARCRTETTQALARGLPVVAVRAGAGGAPPAWLGDAPIIEWASDAAAGWPELHRRIIYLASPEHRLESLARRRDLLRRQAAEAGPAAHRWFASEIETLQRRMGLETARRDDPAGSQSRADDELSAGIRDEYEPESTAEGPTGLITYGAPPVVPPHEFRDRVQQLGDLERHLADPAVRVVAVTGPAGIGKTGVVARLWHRAGTPDSPVAARRLAYLPVHGHRPVNAGAVIWALAAMVSEPEAIEPLVDVVRRQLPVVDKVDAVLAALDRREVVLIIDDAEDLLDPDGELRDRELCRIVDRLDGRDDHGVRLVLCTRRDPDRVLARAGDRGRRVPIGEGLPREFAHEFLCQLDSEGVYGLRDATDHEKDWLVALTAGSPRALELAFGVLRSAPGQPVRQLIERMAQVEPGELVGRLIEWTFEGLDPVDRRIVQALAVYRWPVLPSAVVHLLHEFVPAQEVGPLLDELCRRRLVRRDGRHYYLPRDPDGTFVLATIEPGSPSGDDSELPRFTRSVLFRRAADYFAALRLPTAKVRGVDDLRPAFVEIDLRICAEQFTHALDLIAAVEHAHLLRWGQNGALVPALERLPEFTRDLDREFLRRALLIRAYRQAGDYDSGLRCAQDTVTIARRNRRNAAVARFNSHRGAAHMERGEIGKAIDCYRRGLRAVSWTQRWHMPYERAVTHTGLAICLGRVGRFPAALRHREAATRLLPSFADDEDARLEPQLLIATGWAQAQMGEVERARRTLRSGYDAASRSEVWPLAGQCLHHEADVLLDQGDFHGAVALARQAAELGLRSNSGALCRTANETLALTLLLRDQLDDAAEAAALAARQDASPYGLALAGVIAVRRGQMAVARPSFEAACRTVAKLRAADDADFPTRDVHGLVLFGLATCSGQATVDDACTAFRAARTATSAGGTVRRVQRLLGRFEGHADAGALASVRRAAGGR